MTEYLIILLCIAACSAGDRAMGGGFNKPVNEGLSLAYGFALGVLMGLPLILCAAVAVTWRFLGRTFVGLGYPVSEQIRATRRYHGKEIDLRPITEPEWWQPSWSIFYTNNYAAMSLWGFLTVCGSYAITGVVSYAIYDGQHLSWPLFTMTIAAPLALYIATRWGGKMWARMEWIRGGLFGVLITGAGMI